MNHKMREKYMFLLLFSFFSFSIFTCTVLSYNCRSATIYEFTGELLAVRGSAGAQHVVHAPEVGAPECHLVDHLLGVEMLGLVLWVKAEGHLIDHLSELELELELSFTTCRWVQRRQRAVVASLFSLNRFGLNRAPRRASVAETELRCLEYV